MMANNWFITGTSSGFGRLLLEQLLTAGAMVAATVRDRSALAGLSDQYPTQLRVYELDVTDTPDIRRVLKAAFDDLGRIDVVVSNAGYALLGAAEELSDEQIDQQIATNLAGSIHLLRSAVPHLREQGGGRLIQLASMGSHIAFPGLSLYHATKWGIEGFCEALAQEVASFGISLTMIEPGSAQTNFSTTSASIGSPLDVYEQTPVGRFRAAAAAGLIPMPVDPQRVAEAIIKCGSTEQPPLRMALGSDAYAAIGAALRQRLSDLEANKSDALAADRAA